MPKLQACCERHIAVIPYGQFTAKEMAQHLPSESALRIGDVTRKAFLDLQAEILDFVQKKDCCCSTFASGTGRTVYQRECASCQAFKTKVKRNDLSKYVPSPMEFLKMAQPPARIFTAGPDAATADSPASAEDSIEGGEANAE